MNIKKSQLTRILHIIPLIQPYNLYIRTIIHELQEKKQFIQLHGTFLNLRADGHVLSATQHTWFQTFPISNSGHLQAQAVMTAMIVAVGQFDTRPPTAGGHAQPARARLTSQDKHVDFILCSAKK